MNSKHFKLLSLVALVALGTWACKDDDPQPQNPVASFQYEISDENFLEVKFTNFSQNANTYIWDFGDGNSSTEKDPVHVYDAAGKYTVELIARNGTLEAKRTDVVTVEDPNAALTLLAGTTSKTWYLQREGVALGIGPVADDNQWWSFGGVTPLGDRPCILDDAFTFHRDGKWEFNSNNTLFVDAIANGGWLSDSESCFDEDSPGLWTAHTGEDVSAFANGGDYTYAFVPGVSITINGEGAYIGLPNKTENGDSYIPVSTKVYKVISLTEGDIADSLKLAIEALDGGFAWNFYLVSYHDPNDLPDIPTALPAASFEYSKEDLTVTFKNTSKNATTYMWDFGDGMSSTEKDPVHTFPSDGEYTVRLTASDGSGNMDEFSANILVSSAVYSKDVLSSADGKIWRLNGVASFIVGPTAGSGEWWGGITEADLAARACMLDDEFIFFDDGTMEFDSKGAVFAEPYMGGNNECVNDEDIPSPYETLGSGIHTFTADDGGDPRPTVTVIGKGAYLGFSKGYNGGEYNGTDEPKDQITYDVLDYSKSGNIETLTLTLDISGDLSGTAWWTIVLRSDNN